VRHLRTAAGTHRCRRQRVGSHCPTGRSNPDAATAHTDTHADAATAHIHADAATAHTDTHPDADAHAGGAGTDARAGLSDAERTAGA
jgi:hypothetical protein